MQSSLSRRTVIRGGGVALALPFLEAMRPARAGAAAAQGPRRCVFFFMPHGTVRSEYNPVGSGTSFTLPYVLAPLEPFRNRLVVLRKMNAAAAQASAGNPHVKGAGTLLTARVAIDDGWGAGVSIDRHMGSRVAPMAGVRFPSLQFGVQSARAAGSGSPSRFLSYDGARKPVAPVDNPREMYDRLFKDPIQGAADPAAARVARDKRKAALDFVMEDVRRLRTSLGVADRERLDEHLMAVTTLERRLADPMVTPTVLSCVRPATPAPASFDADGKAHMQLLTMALACDLSRVAVLQWAGGQSELHLTHLGFNHPHHWMSHHMEGGPAQLKVIQRWHIRQLAALCASLDKIREGDRTLLDNTAIVLVSEVAEGPSHSYDDMPFLIVGGCGGALKTGQVLDFSGRASNDLYVTLLQAMGVEDRTFGDDRFNRGPLPGLLA